MVFNEFSNNDVGGESSIIYADIKEMFRLANILGNEDKNNGNINYLYTNQRIILMTWTILILISMRIS